MSEAAQNPQGTPGRKRGHWSAALPSDHLASYSTPGGAGSATELRLRCFPVPQVGTVEAACATQDEIIEVTGVERITGAEEDGPAPVDEGEEVVVVEPQRQRPRRSNAALTWDIAYCLLKVYSTVPSDAIDSRNHRMRWKTVVQKTREMPCLQGHLGWLNVSPNPTPLIKNKTQSLCMAITTGTPETMLQFSGRSNAELVAMVPQAREVLVKHVKQYQMIEARAKLQKELDEKVQQEWSHVFTEINCPLVFQRSQLKRLDEWKDLVYSSENHQSVAVPQELIVRPDLLPRLKDVSTRFKTKQRVIDEMINVIKDCGYTFDPTVQIEKQTASKMFNSVLVVGARAP